MDMEEIYTAMRRMYGTHIEAAKMLGIGSRYYRDIRNGHAHLTQRMERAIRYRFACLTQGPSMIVTHSEESRPDLWPEQTQQKSPSPSEGQNQQ